MAKLIVTLDGQVINEFEINKERVTIGRKPSNDIPIDNLAVSGEHAAITTILDDTFLEDLGSTNGTLVNNIPTQKHLLRHGDEIEIGKYRLKFVDLQALGVKRHAPDPEKTMILRPAQGPEPEKEEPAHGDLGANTVSLATPDSHSHEQAAHTGAESVPATPAEPLPATGKTAGTQAVIQILNGPNAGKELELTKTLTSLGKPGVQVAVITRRPHGYFLTHVEGERHPAVNDQLLDAHPHQLADHDVIELGGVKMEFYLK